MKTFKSCLILLSLLIICPSIMAQDIGVGFISNDIAVYKNSDDDLNNKGWTLQLVFINSVKIHTEFQIEFTADFNKDLAWKGKDDYYMEVGFLKEFYKGISLNYQRIEGTFQPGGINQLGVRYHF
ncbi:MAG: hypothetical protein GY855_12695 [candidate division Zixibacteria bacterium]|nr:hypothetical protein [candidate division Zixibacteria bacterium]